LTPVITDRPERFDSPLILSLSKDEHWHSWFDEYILSETLMLRQAQHERRVEGLTMSGSQDVKSSTRR
jgi:hypothetical protein